jgi:fucose permease
MLVFGIVLLLMGSLLPSLTVSRAQAGNLGSLPLAGIFVGTVVAGPLLDLRGAKPVLTLALALIAGAMAVMSFGGSYAALAGAAFVYGLGGGLLNTGTNALTSSLRAEGRGAALNLLGFFFSLGAVCAPLLMATLGGSRSPQGALRLLAILTALVLIPVLGLRFPPPQAGICLGRLLEALHEPVVWLFGLLLFFESGSENCMFVWSAKTVADVLQVSAARANITLAALGTALGVGRLLAVLWLRWLSSPRLLYLSAGVILAGVFLAHTARGFVSLSAGIATVGLGMAAIFPTALGIAGDRYPDQTGTVFGAIMTVALLGGITGPRLAAALAARTPLDVLWIPVFASLAVFLLTPILH